MTPREQLLRFVRREDCGPLPIGFRLGREVPGWVRQLDIPVCERTYDSAGYDVFGVHWSCLPPAPSHPSTHRPPVITDIEDWEEQLRVPKLERFDWAYLRAQNEAIDRERLFVSATLCIGPFERTTMLSSFEDCLVNAISEPEAYGALIGAIIDFRIAYIHRIADNCKPDLLVLHDDWGSNLGPIINPKLWRETIKPHLRRLYAVCREREILICQHSCGCLGPLVDELAELGADAWEGQGDCQPLAALAREYRDRLLILDSKVPVAETAVAQEMFGGATADLRPQRQFMGYDTYPAFLYE